MKCSICQGIISDSEEQTTCNLCMNSYHTECWNENKGCGTPGCPNLPKIQTKSEQHFFENSYWGISEKTCPACGERINVGLYKCPYCKEDFDTNAPIDRLEFKSSRLSKRNEGMPVTAKIAIAVFLGGIIGCLAPFNLVIGGIWFIMNRKTIKEESGYGYILSIIGLVFSLLFVTFGIVMIALRIAEDG